MSSTQIDADRATVIARRVVRTLQNRKGFDWWWQDIDPADRRDIIRDLSATIQKSYRVRS